MVVRDGSEGRIEVLLLQRNPRSEFVGGAHVFPGGALDPDDGTDGFAARCAGRTDARCSAQLGIRHGGLAWWVAGLRECFEEAGLLLARHPGEEQVLSFEQPAVARRFAAHRAAVLSGHRFLDVLAEEHLVLDVGAVHLVSRWVTPEGSPRRYDTCFFVAAAPPGQVPLHDDGETVASAWMAPDDALARHRNGELAMVLPTLRNLEALNRHRTVQDLLAASRAVVHVPTVRPRLVADGTGVRILVPGDAGYDDVPCGTGP